MPYDIGVRKELNKRGIDNSRIGFDFPTQTVLVDNKPFLKPQKNYNGTTFTDQPSFMNAYNQLTSSQSQGDTVQHPPTFMSSTNSRETPDYHQLIGQLYTQLHSPQSFDPYSSPQYAAAQAQSQRGAQDAIRAAQESLGSAGFGRSTVLGQTAQKAQNQANQYLQTQIVPQIMSQHQNEQQQKFNNLSSLIGTLLGLDQQQFNRGIAEAGITGNYNNQRTLQGQQADLNKEQIDAALTGQIPDGQGGMRPTTAREQQLLNNAWKTAEELGTVTSDLAQLTGIPEGTPTQAAKQQVAQNEIQRINAQTANKNADNQAEKLRQENESKAFDRALEIYTKTGQVPDELNQYGINVEGLNNGETKTEIQGLYQELAGGQVDPETALKRIDDAEKIGLKDKATSDELRKTIYLLYPQYSPESLAKQKERSKTITDTVKKDIIGGIPTLSGIKGDVQNFLPQTKDILHRVMSIFGG